MKVVGTSIGILLLLGMVAMAEEPQVLLQPAEKVKEASETVTIDKAVYERLLLDNKRLTEEVQRLQKKRQRLLVECEQLVIELAILKQRLSRALQCSTIQEMIEELQLNQNAERKENKE